MARTEAVRPVALAAGALLIGVPVAFNLFFFLRLIVRLGRARRLSSTWLAWRPEEGVVVHAARRDRKGH
jgi:hypothetical protein